LEDNLMASHTVPVDPPLLSRPVLFAAWTYAAMIAWIAICTPLIPDVDPVEYFFTGLIYCLILDLFVIGLMLAGRRAFQRWIFTTTILVVGMAGFSHWLIKLAEPSTMFQILPWLTGGLLAMTSVYLLVGLVIAGAGWARYIRGYWNAKRGARAG
jgi:hypothetical protein